MSKVSSVLELQDGWSKSINSAIDAVNRLTSSLDGLNRTANSTTAAAKPFTEIHTSANTANPAVEQLTASVEKLVGGMESLNMSSRMDNVDREFGEMRTQTNLTNEQLEKLNTNLQQLGSHTKTVAAVGSGFGNLSKAILVANNGLQLMQTTWQATKSIGENADQRIGVDARLGLINDGLQTQEQLERKVMAAANATRSEYGATGALVASMGRQDYFKGNNDKAIQFAETVNKGLVVSGASATEASGALIQLNQGLASGVLRGDEFNSIMENAPILAEMMTKSMGITKGQLRSMAEQGQLTSEVVVSSIMAQAGVLDSQFSKMPMTFGQATNIIKNDVSQLMNHLAEPGHAVNIIIQQIEQLTAYLNTPQGTAMVDNISGAITTAANVISWFFGLVVDTYNFFANNWSWIGPIVLGVAAAIGIVAAATLVYNAVMTITNFIEAFSIAAAALHTGSTLAEAAAMETATGAQVGLNTAMLANPVTWIIAAVILLIVVIYAVVGAINQATGSSISATGVICGAFATAGAFIGNIFIAAFNLVIDIVAVLYNAHATFAEFLANVFIDPIGSIIRLFSGLANTVLGILKSIASAIDTLFGSHLADAVSGWQSSLQGWTDKVAGKAKIQVPRMDASAMHLQRLNYGGAYNAGYKVGQGIDNKVGNLMSNVTGLSDKLANLGKSATPLKNQNYGNGYKGLTPSSGKTKKGKVNGGTLDKVDKIGSAVDISDQSLQYLNDIAANQALSRLDSYQTLTYEQMNALQLSPQDADALRRSANSSNNIYYLNYSGGGVHIQNDIHKGEDWETIKRKAHDETEDALDAGISGIDEVVYG